jgi:U3 small nucleolar RNA-associated protein 10
VRSRRVNDNNSASRAALKKFTLEESSTNRPEMTSLAGQLAQSASLNTGLLVDRSRRKSAESYLFTGREADQHDLDSIYALGVNGLLQLASLDSSLLPFEDKLFSDHAKSTDRTLLSSEANAQLDESIDACLSLLGPYLMETPTGKVIEWLVRRFRCEIMRNYSQHQLTIIPQDQRI